MATTYQPLALALALVDLEDKRRLYGEIERDYYAAAVRSEEGSLDDQLSNLAAEIDAIERRCRTIITTATGVPFATIMAANL